MTDNEIIKALECCKSNDLVCDICPMNKFKIPGTGNCIDKILIGAIDLINRQKAEIEGLREELYHAKVEISKHFDYMDKVENEAIDVFANSLKIKLNRTIENLVKEMTEVSENDI